jgi:CPA2 family monovalent cation:H+ antiporter-2
MAEIGVVMLLFTIGLEFEPARLKRIRRNFSVGGSLQVALTTAVTIGLLWGLFGVRFEAALFYGFLVSLSSTAVVLKILGDRGELDSPQGRISLGVLIFQDLAVVPMIALVPVLANAGTVSAGAIAIRFALSGAVIAAVFALARFLMPGLLHLVVRTRIREIFLIATLFLCLGMALLTSSLGLSLALGAFLAGVLLPNPNTATRSSRTSCRSRMSSTACSSSPWACSSTSGRSGRPCCRAPLSSSRGCSW